MSLGIDLGSTYSIVATYRADRGILEHIPADSNTDGARIPSILALDDDGLDYGTSAKSRTGDEEVRTFKAFKMLLANDDINISLARGYDLQHTPQWATKEFLNCLIKRARENTEIDKLVIGAPDIWFHKFGTLSSRSLIQKYCNEIEGVKEVKIVNEPVLASAYFAYNFQNQSGKPFDGNLLIIDYGGGTLDLSLTEVKKRQDGFMEIRMLESTGAGENSNDDASVGKAGIIYMETLMKNLIEKEAVIDINDVLGTEQFYKAVNQVENIIINTKVKEKFDKEGHITDSRILKRWQLDRSVRFKGHKYVITYNDLKVAYDEVINQVFDEKMEEMIKLAEARGIDLYKDQGDKLKICLVGGFGNFYFVEKQMRSKLKYNADDCRGQGIIATEMDRERAISYGAALIAAGVVGIRRTAPYSLGICSQNLEGTAESIDYMVKYNQEITVNEVEYLKKNSGNSFNASNDPSNYKYISLSDGMLKDCFVIDYGNGSKDNIHFTVKKEKQSEFADLISKENRLKTCVIGVSFNDSNVPSLHIREYFLDKRRMADEDTKVIELDDFSNIFEERQEDRK